MTSSHANLGQLLPADDDLNLIIKVGPARQQEAISRLLAAGRASDGDHARRFMEYARDHRVNLDEMWGRLDPQGRIESTFLAVPNPGRTAMVFASAASSRSQAQKLASLIAHGTSNLTPRGINLAQALLEAGDELAKEIFVRAGYSELAILNYMERPIRARRGERFAQPQWPQGITTTTYDETLRDELIELLDRTYEDTLDCPGLRGHRRTEDILEGHRASGRFTPALWTVLRRNDEAIGALLLNPSADHHAVELVYLGLIKSARGQGLGRALLRFGLNSLQKRNERLLTLAVDEANGPAVELYLSEGFRPALRRRAMTKPVP